jgi:hypothetical protein
LGGGAGTLAAGADDVADFYKGKTFRTTYLANLAVRHVRRRFPLTADRWRSWLVIFASRREETPRALAAANTSDPIPTYLQYKSASPYLAH